MITAFTRLPLGDSSAVPPNMSLALVESVEHDQVVFWLVDEKRRVSMPLKRRQTRGDFMVGATRFYAVLESGGREAVA